MRIGSWVRPRDELFAERPKANWGAGVIEQFLPDGEVKVRYAYSTDPRYGSQIHKIVSLVECDCHGHLSFMGRSDYKEPAKAT